MPIRNLHEKPFDKGTQDKLELYRKYLRGWLPVFIHAKHPTAIQIFDFFAGPGIDVEGNSGSPSVACEEIRAAFSLTGKPLSIKSYFNEYDLQKYNSLKSFVAAQSKDLPQVEFITLQKDFHDAFNQWKPSMHRNTSNLLFIDQNGVRQISKSIFQTIVALPRTDLLFFISSGTINRFKEQSEIIEYVPVTDEDLSEMNGTNVHRIVADAYRRWLPEGFQYFLGSFSIRKGPNVYGLIFGSGHPLGIDKFLRIAWEKGGDANFDIDDDRIDPMSPSLFPELDKPTKIKVFEKRLKAKVLERRLKNNKDAYLFALQNGMLARHAKDALTLMVKDKTLPQQTFHVSYDAWKKRVAEPISHFVEDNL
jgi:three-Cys-motif partner protein